MIPYNLKIKKSQKKMLQERTAWFLLNSGGKKRSFFKSNGEK